MNPKYYNTLHFDLFHSYVSTGGSNLYSNYKQFKQSSDNRCVLVRTCTSICSINCSFTCTFVLVLLKCSTNCLNLRFHTLTYLYFAQKRRFFKISDWPTNWPTDGPTDWLRDGPTNWLMDGPNDKRMDGQMDGWTHPLIIKRCENASKNAIFNIS